MKRDVAAILLAAGLSRRMGTCKQLLPLGEKTVIGRCLETLLRGGIGEIVVVVGPEGETVAEAARIYPVKVVRTADPGGDMAASVRTGRDALSPVFNGVLICLCDHPLVAPETVGLLAALHREGQDRIIIPQHGGRKGHPTLFPRRFLDGLVKPLTLRDLLQRNQERLCLVEVADQGVCLDMDTPEEYRRVAEIQRVSTAPDRTFLSGCPE